MDRLLTLFGKDLIFFSKSLSQDWTSRGVAAVEDVETFARAAAGRFLARTMCDPVRTVVVGAGDPVLEGKGELSLGGGLLARGG